MGNLKVKLADHVIDDQFGVDDASLHPFAKTPNRTVHEDYVITVALEVILIISDRIERGGSLTRSEFGIKHLKPKEMINRSHFGERQKIRRITAQNQFGIRFKDVVSDFICRAERCTIDLRQLGKFIDGGTAFALIIGISNRIAKLIGIAHIAAKQRGYWVAAQAVFITVSKEFFECRRRIGLGRGFCRSGCSGGNDQRGKAGKQHGGEFNGHGRRSGKISSDLGLTRHTKKAKLFDQPRTRIDRRRPTLGGPPARLAEITAMHETDRAAARVD